MIGQFDRFTLIQAGNSLERGKYKSLSYCVTLKECKHAFSFVYGRNRTRSWGYTFTHAVQKAEMQTGMASQSFTRGQKKKGLT